MDKKDYFRIIDHPSDIGLEITAERLKKIFELAAVGMFAIISDLGKIKIKLKKAVEIVKDDSYCIEDMLVFWLEKLIYYFEVDNIIFSRFDVKKIRAVDYDKEAGGNTKSNRKQEIRAIAYGEQIELNRHEIFTAIKSPTYHNLSIKKEENSDLWKATVIFDV